MATFVALYQWIRNQLGDATLNNSTFITENFRSFLSEDYNNKELLSQASLSGTDLDSEPIQILQPVQTLKIICNKKSPSIFCLLLYISEPTF